MNQVKSIVLSATLLATVFAGCTPAPPAAAPAPTPPAAPTPAAAKPAAPKPAAAKPAEPAKPVELVAMGPNFLYNASLEMWEDDGRLMTWNLAEGVEPSWKSVDAKKVAAAPKGGNFAAELPAPSEDQTVVMSQTVLDGKIVPLRRLVVSAQVNSQEKESVHMLLTYQVGQQTETIRRVSQGGDSWSTLSAEFWVPKEADTSSFRIQFIVQKGVKKPVLIDDVRIQTMYPKGTVLPEEVAAAAPAAPVAVKAESPAKVEAPAAKPEATSEKSDSKKSSDDSKSSTKKTDKKSTK